MIFSTVVGGYFLIRLGGFFILHPWRTARGTVRALRHGGKHPCRTLTLALAGTLGVGNITGTAFALMTGGAGALFWMWVSAVFAMTLKYAESVATLSHGDGGILGLAAVVFRRFGRVAAGGYSVLCLVCAAAMGAALQTRTVAVAANAAFGVPLFSVTGAVALLVAVSVWGGVGRIERAVAVTVPAASVLYIVLCLSVLTTHAAEIPAALCAVMRAAFRPSSAVGGIGGVLLSRAVREGYAGGLLSNEAGAGTSTLAHARNADARPTDEGYLGMCEVFFDTAVLCTLTALTLLVGSGGTVPTEGDGMTWLSDVLFRTVGGLYRLPLLLSVFAFAYSTSVCWYYYGERSSDYLFGKRARPVCRVGYILAAALGGLAGTSVVVRITDVCLFGLSAVTLSALLLSADRVVRVHRGSLQTEKEKKKSGGVNSR